jgi:GH15 family glucan-1,4-alpha-glucosidase
MHPPISDYALIGDCETAALVGRNGSIDWLCWPRFDSGACFAALLGRAEHGYWRIAPKDGHRAVSRRYRGDTLVLETLFESDGGSASVIDFMPIREGDAVSEVIRLVVGRRGSVTMQSRLALRFDCGRLGHPPRAAARAEAAALATERDQLLGLTGLALDPKESVLEQAALEIGLELIFHVPWQGSPPGRPAIPELRIVLGHEPVE